MSVKYCKLLIYKFHYCISHLAAHHLWLYTEPLRSQSQALLLCKGAEAAHPHFASQDSSSEVPTLSVGQCITHSTGHQEHLIQKKKKSSVLPTYR